jgi:hypothetical protein
LRGASFWRPIAKAAFVMSAQSWSVSILPTYVGQIVLHVKDQVSVALRLA